MQEKIRNQLERNNRPEDLIEEYNFLIRIQKQNLKNWFYLATTLYEHLDNLKNQIPKTSLEYSRSTFSKNLIEFKNLETRLQEALLFWKVLESQ